MSRCVPELHEPTRQHRGQSRDSPALFIQYQKYKRQARVKPSHQSKQTKSERQNPKTTVQGQNTKKAWMEALVCKYVDTWENYALWTSSHTEMFLNGTGQDFVKKKKKS